VKAWNDGGNTESRKGGVLLPAAGRPNHGCQGGEASKSRLPCGETRQIPAAGGTAPRWYCCMFNLHSVVRGDDRAWRQFRVEQIFWRQYRRYARSFPSMSP